MRPRERTRWNGLLALLSVIASAHAWLNLYLDYGRAPRGREFFWPWCIQCDEAT
jgi:hypothetical protein